MGCNGCLCFCLPPPGAGGDSGSFYKGTDVVTLTDGNFEEEVMSSDDIWFVEVGGCCSCFCCSAEVAA